MTSVGNARNFCWWEVGHHRHVLLGPIFGPHLCLPIAVRGNHCSSISLWHRFLVLLQAQGNGAIPMRTKPAETVSQNKCSPSLNGFSQVLGHSDGKLTPWLKVFWPLYQINQQNVDFINNCCQSLATRKHETPGSLGFLHYLALRLENKSNLFKLLRRSA